MQAILILLVGAPLDGSRERETDRQTDRQRDSGLCLLDITFMFLGSGGCTLEDGINGTYFTPSATIYTPRNVLL